MQIPAELKVKTLGLPRWAWIALLAGGVGVGLYLRHKDQSTGSETEPETEPGQPSTPSSLVPPAAGIEPQGGGGDGTGSSTTTIPKEEPRYEGEKPEKILPHEEEFEHEPELPNSSPPSGPQNTSEGGILPGSQHETPGGGVIAENTSGEKIGIGGGQPAPGGGNGGGGGKIGIGENEKAREQKQEREEREKKERIQGEQSERTAQEKQQKKHAEIERLQGEKNNIINEINRLQGEISGLQNHISQLTAVLQEHPKATQRPQWEAERNQDRANIENKQNNINQLRANEQNKSNEINFWNNW